MPATVAPAPSFSLSDFTQMENPPADDLPVGGKTVVEQPAAAPQIAVEEPIISPLSEEEMVDNPPAAKPDDDEAPDNLGSALNRQPETARQDAENVEEEKKKTAAAAAAPQATEDERAKATKQAEADARDADLKIEHAPHTHQKTRKIISDFQTKARDARNERDRVAAEKVALQRERDELAEKIKTAPAPKALEDEVKLLRERVRELDITRDPILETKYDKRIEANNTSIIAILKKEGYGMQKGEGDKMVENPQAIQKLVRDGLTLKNLTPLLKKLDEAELVEEAEAIREAVRQNNRLSAEKTQEIESWKGDFTKRQEARQQQGRQASDKFQADFTKQTDTQYRAEVETLAKDFAYLKQPPAPLATDTPAVRQAKETAITEFQTAAKKIEAEVKTLNPGDFPPERHAEVAGRINANAILALTLKNHVLPRVQRDLAALTARNKELEGELAKIRGAGRISRLHGSAPSDAPAGGGEAPTDLGQALMQARPGS